MTKHNGGEAMVGTKRNLCRTCSWNFPDCEGEPEFGDGVGNDNEPPCTSATATTKSHRGGKRWATPVPVAVSTSLWVLSLAELKREIEEIKEGMIKLTTNLGRDEEMISELEQRRDYEPECVAHMDEVTCYCRDCQTDRYVKERKEMSL